MGVVVKEEICEKVVEVGRVSNRMMELVLAFEDDVLRLISEYAPQSGRSFEKQTFYGLKSDWDMHNVDDIVVCLVTLMDMCIGTLKDLTVLMGVMV